MVSARSKLVRLAMAGGALALLGINVFTINCGFAPTDIGGETTAEEYVALDPQPAALFTLIQERDVVLETGGDPLCISFGDSSPGHQADPSAFKLYCSVFKKTAEGVTEETNSGHCRLTVVGQAAPRQTVVLECAVPGAEPCLGQTLELGRLTTDTDFQTVSIADDDDDPNGQVSGDLRIVDGTNPAVTATIHAERSYCVTGFGAP